MKTNTESTSSLSSSSNAAASAENEEELLLLLHSMQRDNPVVINHNDNDASTRDDNGDDDIDIDDDDDDWTQYEDMDAMTASAMMRVDSSFSFDNQSSSSSVNNSNINLGNFYPPLLPGPSSFGDAKRVSSCYFSLASTSSEHGSTTSLADLLSQLDCAENEEHEHEHEEKDCDDYKDNEYNKPITHTNLFIYHDILMHVFEYLDTTSLAAFSETAKRPNFEVFYYLKLQLQQALLLVVHHHHPTSSSTTSTTCQSRNEQTINDNDQSNSSNLQQPQQQQQQGEGVSWTMSLPSSTILRNRMITMTSTTCLSRLASMDLYQAELVVEEFIQSNETLRHTMPLSHTLAYIRSVLQRRGLLAATTTSTKSPGNPSALSSPSSSSLASAALLVTVLGATASILSSNGAAAPLSGGEVSFMEQSAAMAELLPNLLFRLGFVGSLMGAAATTTKHMSSSSSTATAAPTTHTNTTISLREAAEQMAKAVQEFRSNPSLMMELLRDRLQKTLGSNSKNNSIRTSTSTPLQKYKRNMSQSSIILCNPYDHLPSIEEKKLEDDDDTYNDDEEDQTNYQSNNHNDNNYDNHNHAKVSTTTTTTTTPLVHKKMPSGCVGAYYRAIHKAATIVSMLVKERRRTKFLSLEPSQRQQLATAFLDACTSDQSLSFVQKMIHSMDIDGFYTAFDNDDPRNNNNDILFGGSETCALHTAAFHGATQVLEFLCRGIDTTIDYDVDIDMDMDTNHDDDDYHQNQNHGNDNPVSAQGIDHNRRRRLPQDGGLVDINGRDINGWTALHFAAGANSVTAIRVLAQHGADLTVQANNGYTPLQWAMRLSNDEAAEELKEQLLLTTKRRMAGSSGDPTTTGWMSRQPLTNIANRFFSMIPSH